MIRPLRDSDIPRLREMAESSGFPYCDPKEPHVEAVLVATDEHDRPVMAIAANRIVELYLWADSGLSPVTAFALLRQFHEEMARVLREKGYTDATAFLPPAVEKRFGRRLERSFGWVRNLASWAKVF